MTWPCPRRRSAKRSWRPCGPSRRPPTVLPWASPHFPIAAAPIAATSSASTMQKALRSRLKDKAWAVVLERQYPTALLEEVDLARAGLVRDNAVEKLPPADLVILGSMEDVGNEYEAGKPWAVKLDLTLRLRGHSNQISQTCRSDAIEAAADDIMRKIEEFRRQPASQTAVPEKELWRRQAMYLMPPRCETWCQGHSFPTSIHRVN